MFLSRRVSVTAITATTAGVALRGFATRGGASAVLPLAAGINRCPLPTTFAQQHQPVHQQTRSYCSAAPQGAGALDVALKVNKLKRMHQTGQGEDKKRIEMTAWKELNTLSENQIAAAEGKAVALLLSSWAYFAKFWEKGKDGPYISEEKATQASDRPEGA